MKTQSSKNIFLKNTLAIVVASIAAGAVADGRIEGQVKTTDYGVALEGVKVRIVELNRTATSQRDGRFIFVDVKPGTYTLETSYIGADAVSQRVKVIDNTTARTQFQLSGVSGIVENVIVIGQAAGRYYQSP